MKKTIALASLLVLALGVPAAQAAKFYKWTDDNGVTHYTVEAPPAGAKSSQVRIKTQSITDAEESPPAPGIASQKRAPAADKDSKPKPVAQPAKDEQEGKEKAANAGKYAEKCSRLQTDLKTIQEHARVQEVDDKGEQRTLTEEERNNRLDATRREIKAYCE